MPEPCVVHKKYQAGCVACAAYTRHQHREYAKQRARRGPLRVDARPVVTHMRTLLDAGCSQAGIARASGVSGPFISVLLAGAHPRVSVGVFDALLAVTVRDAAGEDFYVPALPVVRRLQHLVWMGWSQTAIGAGTGMSQQAVSEILHGGQLRVSRDRADRIMAFYREHWMVDGGSFRARNAARANGWVSIMAWDNPDEVAA